MEVAALEDTLPQAPAATTVQFGMEGENVLHFAALPNGETSIEPVKYPEDPYLKYKFEFDSFQKCAIACVHNHDSVLVSAHTSAGKTVIAKYAIASALKHNQRVIYTSPIKALSNQKFKEFVDEFDPDPENQNEQDKNFKGKKGLVGLATGDVVINPNAPILVMTTEILRMMLFTGDSMIHEVAWVIYDEVHYMKDPSRGVVWEESIIMLPDAVRFVFLSATIPNAREFSEWIAKIHKQVCHVVYTEHRPVPLHYYLSPIGDPQKYKVRDADGEINDQAFAIACSRVKVQTEKTKTFGNVVVKNSQQAKTRMPKKAVAQHTCNIVKSLYDSKLDPMIIFVFSRKDCDKMYQHLGEINFLKKEETDLVEQVFNNAMAQISLPEDRELPQILSIKNLVLRGIGVHHGGLMPILKEIVELLFQFHLIKVLFATETFAMGLNMPAKTVVFNSLYKWDGDKLRLITTSEFIQMAGRAGRRNRDNFGEVVINYAGEPQPADLKGLMVSAAQPLNSEFRITNNMILNLMTQTNGDPKRIMRSSFHQFQMERQLPELRKRREDAIAAANAIEFDEKEGLSEEKTKKAVEYQEKIKFTESQMRKIVFSEDNCKTFLVPGRIVKLFEWGYSVVASPLSKGALSVITMACATSGGNVLPPTRSKVMPQPTLVNVGLSEFESISPNCIDVSFDSLNSKIVGKIISSVKKLEKNGIPMLDGKDIVQQNKEEYMKYREEHDSAVDILGRIGNIDQDVVSRYMAKRGFQEEAEELAQKIADMELLANQKDLDAMMNLLYELSFIKRDDSEGNSGYIIDDKGRIAALINAGDEIMITELLVNGWLKNDDSPARLAALLSVFVAEDKEEGADIEGYEMQWDQVVSTANRIADMAVAAGVPLDKEQYVDKFINGNIRVVEEWASGVSFATLMKEHPSLYEGSIIRTFKRLDELIKQVSNAAKKLGNDVLAKNILASSELINRAIVQTKSLYTEK